MLPITGKQGVAAEGLTTQHWAVLAARPREKADGRLRVGDLAR